MGDYYLVNVYLPLNLSGSYTYKVAKDVAINVGDMVLVPLRNKPIHGIVVEVNVTTTLASEKIKFVHKKISSIASLSQELIDFLQWLSKYTMYSFGNVLKMAINVSGFNFDKQDEYLEVSESADYSKTTPKRLEIIQFVKQDQPIFKSTVLSHFNKSSLVALLIKEQILNKVLVHKKYTLQNNIVYNNIVLNPSQQQVAIEIDNKIQENKFNPIVLHGVPGSGKTEVYFSAVKKVLEQNKQVLILLPEIALSTQLVSQFKQRFGVEAFVWHSDISKARKQEVFLAANNGDLKVIIGARSSLFLPFKHLGLIVVDEEHDTSYKQEEGVIYNAKDMAVVRAKLNNIPIILVSATPSLETLNNVANNKYSLFTLSNRFNDIALPDITVIDMYNHKSSIISEPLIEAIKATLAKQQQVLLFVNKRGYSGAIYCNQCKESVVCKNCAVNMVYHKHANNLVCHYCGYNVKLHHLDCNICLSKNSLNFVGVGVEKLHEELLKIFPAASSVILSSDTLHSNSTRSEIFKDILDNKYNILIGTQIIAKGYNFPNLTLVGIIDADFINPTDFKSTEKAWQLMYQVAGRSGRFNRDGKVILQTYKKDDFLIESLVKKDYNLFVESVTKSKKNALMPPFSKWVAVVVAAQDKKLLASFCNYLAEVKPAQAGCDVLGPIEAPIGFLRGFYRQRFLVKATHNVNIQSYVKSWLNKVKIPSLVKLQIDVDPVSFY